MSYTLTETRTFTITHARYVASKIAADLQLVHSYHGRPSEQDITEYAEEAALLLAARYLKSVEYGFRRDGLTVFALKYTARSDGSLVADDAPGRAYADIKDSDTFYSYLEYSDSYWKLGEAERARVKASLPVNRTGADAPQASPYGYWEQNRTYSANGEGVVRNVFRMP